ncbi:MAG: CapA family protein, partial [Lachnospiraceae bacterium]|nr:CapA family protein [Lachnospiraceae bacterium]
ITTRISRLRHRNGPKATGINIVGTKQMKRIGLTIMALVSTGAILYLLWRGGAFLPRWISWQSGSFYDSSESYEIVLQNNTVEIFYSGEAVWNSPKGVKVQAAMSCDIDNDGMDELLLLCWKIGRYGSHKPFWVEHDEKKWSQHIFVYEYENGKIKAKWMSSDIGQDVAKMEESGREAPFNRLLLTAPDGKISRFRWDFWGFTKEDTEVSFVVFGDNLIHEPIYRYGLRQEGAFDFLFENMEAVIAESDVAAINQETPLVEKPEQYGDYPRFGTPVQVGQAIVDAGFDVVTCATNHVLDRGGECVSFTKEFFTSHGILCLGINAADEADGSPYAIIVRNGIRFAFFNYTYGTNGIRVPEENPNMVHLLDDEEQIMREIEKAKEEADFLIVFVHWGTEYAEKPDEFQLKWTQVFLDSKVDVVVGTHPHVLQPCEMLQDDTGHEMLVYYSIGNYISAQNEESCVKGGMAGFTVSLTAEGFRVTEYSLQPLTITRVEDGRYSVDFK